MSVERVDRPDDRRVSDYLHVTDRELLLARGLFVAEGRFVVQRVIEHGHYAVRSLLLSDASCEALSPHLARLAPETPVYVCAVDFFQHVTGYNIHRGCLALVARPDTASVEHVMSGARLIVVLEGVADADNVGGVFRNAAAFGADAVLLSPTTCDPLYRKAIRTSMGATLSMPFARFDGWPEDLKRLKQRGFTIVALTPREPSETLDDFVARPRRQNVALLIGAEGSGVSERAMTVADLHVRIPMRPGVDSLNLAVSAGIALSRLSTQKS